MGDNSGPTTEAEFRTALNELLVTASKNGVRVADTRWAFRNTESGIQSCEVEIVPVADSTHIE